MNQSFKDQLKAWKKDHMEIKQHGRKKQKKRRNNELSAHEIKKLMGMDKPVFRKYRGSFRQR